LPTEARKSLSWSTFALRATVDNLSPDHARRLVEAAGVEFEIRAIDNFLMVRDFWR
jgi:hypothetical protein